MTITPDQKLLADALERNKYDDWYSAILQAAIEKTKDAKKAVEIADKVFKEHPKDESEPREDDADALFGGKE